MHKWRECNSRTGRVRAETSQQEQGKWPSGASNTGQFYLYVHILRDGMSACVSREGRRNGGLTILISHGAPPPVVLRCACISSCTDTGTGTVGWDGVERTWRQRKQEYWKKQESRGGNIWAISEGVCESRQEGCFHTNNLAEVQQGQESVY